MATNASGSINSPAKEHGKNRKAEADLRGLDAAAHRDAIAEQLDDLDDEGGCECEMDWDCGRHGGPRLTWIETRYQGLDEEEARALGLEPF